MRQGISLLLKLILCILVFSITVSAATPDYFVAYQITSGFTKTDRVYFKDNGTKVRLELKTSKGELIIIARKDKNVTWELMPEAKTFTEYSNSFNPDNWEMYRCNMKFLATKAKKIGEETILGYKCDIYNYKEGSDNITISVSQKEKILLKSIVESGKKKAVMEAKEVKIGKLDGSLFEIPAGYQQFNLSLPILPNM